MNIGIYQARPQNVLLWGIHLTREKINIIRSVIINVADTLISEDEVYFC
jgi:hypothetical protein